MDMTRRRENIQLTTDIRCLKKSSRDKGGWEDNDFKHIQEQKDVKEMGVEKYLIETALDHHLNDETTHWDRKVDWE